MVNGDGPAVDAEVVNGHHAEEEEGKNGVVKNGSYSNGDGNGHFKADSGVDLSAAPVGLKVKPSTAPIQEQEDQKKNPYPYNTEPEPGNPTVMPTDIWSRFHFAFLIRDPHFSVPSYYRCTIPPLDDITGFHNYDPSEAGYDEVRRTFDYLRNVGLVCPHVATHEDDNVNDDDDDAPKPVVAGIGPGRESGAEICVVDADDMLEKPAPTIEAFCRSVGLDYDPGMLNWDNEDDHQFARDAFEKWRGFHNDAIESRGLETKEPVSTTTYHNRKKNKTKMNKKEKKTDNNRKKSNPKPNTTLNGARNTAMREQHSSAGRLTPTCRITCT